VSDDSLIMAMPDVVAFMRPDGVITHHLGGRQVAFLRGSGNLAGRRLDEVLDAHVAELVARLVRRAIASRDTCEAEFSVAGAAYHARLSPQGPQRVLCVIRSLGAAPAADAAQEPARAAGDAERRGFVRRFQQSVSDATLRERPLALCIIWADGLADIGQLIDLSIGERIMTELLRRLPCGGDTPDGSNWYVGQIGEALLGVVVDGSDDRDRIRAIARSLCDSIARPIQFNDATFQLAPYAGVAILGRDASRPPALLDHARAAMLEARRSAAGTIQFYSDTLRMLPVARLDIERELRRGIEEGQIGLRYSARHELSSGRVAGIHAYMRWVHPLRGEIAPAQFLPIADATGLSPAVSRAALERLAEDVPTLRARFGRDIPISFGPLRQHISSGQLIEDCRRLASSSQLPLDRLELRIAERTLASLYQPERALAEMVEIGARLIVDELGRGFTSFTRLPQLPLSALQIDRALVLAAGRSGAALRSCRAIAALAYALEVLPIAAGVDDEAARACMVQIGCVQGLGDLYRPIGEISRESGGESRIHARVPR
jgi:predicted signal transduction protein with EAL and GGDEF domain